MTTTFNSFSIFPLIQGFLLCISMIIAVGPQNLFLLRQGMKREYLFTIAFFSTVADLLVISLGVGGLSAIISTNAIVQMVATVGGILFLIVCGVRSLINVFRPTSSEAQSTVSQAAASGIVATILTTLSFSLLNPATYLETLMIIGSKSLVFSGEQRLVFGIGAALASAIWFFTLTYGASRLSPIFRSKLAWRALDVVSGFIMLGLAVNMIASSASTL
jgi:L-lysine exporter family protein LysE/ArgO